MSCSISSISYCPVKTLSFQSIETCNVKKDLGMINDRIFAFSRGVDLEKAKSMEKNPKERRKTWKNEELTKETHETNSRKTKPPIKNKILRKTWKNEPWMSA